MWGTSLARGLPPAIGATFAGAAAVKYLNVSPHNTVHCAEAAFSNSEFRAFKVSEITDVNHDTKLIRCKLPSPQHVMGITVSSAVLVNGMKDASGKAPARPYTPTTTNQTKGYFELMVKGYPSGVVSKHLCSLKVGDEIEVKGPLEKLPYTPNMKKHIGMVAGGSGITPMLQILKEALHNPKDTTQFTLIFGNQTPDDILLRAELQKMEESSGGRLEVFYLVDKNPSRDKGVHHVGYLTKDVAALGLPPPSPDTLVYVCGPPGMMKAVSGGKKFEKGKPPSQGEVEGILKELGYTVDMVYKL